MTPNIINDEQKYGFFLPKKKWLINRHDNELFALHMQ